MEWINYFVTEDTNDLIFRKKDDDIIFIDPLLHIIYDDLIKYGKN
ncbi:hypothetical protein [Clostridium lundense]|nr:hypothetical protein [Clostridium lundense]